MPLIPASSVSIYKKIGETPLEALERFRVGEGEVEPLKMTYAGRLDPMAEGELIILIGEECKNKQKYLNLDKEYEVEIVFGISTDTGDALGLVREVEPLEVQPLCINLQKYIGKFNQSYPAYSSKTVNGVQLHELARKGLLPEEMPEKEVEIYFIDLLACTQIDAGELKSRIFKNIDLVNGDFRQKEIKDKWNEIFVDAGSTLFDVLKIKVKCSSGTYMRSLAERMGDDVGTGAFALGIKRTKIFK